MLKYYSEDICMLTMNDFCKKEYGQKLYKISFDAGFTCPNRDGTCGSRGCIFCSAGGSGDFAVKLFDCNTNFEDQIQLAKDKVSKKYKGDKFIAYFQAFTNTYAPVSKLRDIYMPIINRDDIAVLSIATRPDCITDETYELLDELNHIKPVWVELGLQTTNESSIEYICRGYDTKMYDDAIVKLNRLGIHTITHIILYLPGESKSDMLDTVKHTIKIGTQGIKFSLLHVLEGTDLADDYAKNNFYIPSLEEYSEMIKACLELCPDDIVIHRLTGDAPKKILIEPKWTADKKKVLNTLKDVLAPAEDYYVYMLMCGDGSFYTGSTNDVRKRFAKHSAGLGCKYTKTHQPVQLIYVENCYSKRAALQREYAIKQLSKPQKIKLLDSSANIIACFQADQSN